MNTQSLRRLGVVALAGPALLGAVACSGPQTPTPSPASSSPAASSSSAKPASSATSASSAATSASPTATPSASASAPASSSSAPASSGSAPASSATSAPQGTSPTKAPHSGATPAAVPPAQGTSDPAACAPNELKIGTTKTDAENGQYSVVLDVVNVGNRTCTINGYPTLSLIGEDGKQIGAVAEKDPTTQPSSVSLAPQARATATIRFTNAGPLGEACTQQEAASLRVYMPNRSEGVDLPFTAIGCTQDSQKVMKVLPFKAI